MDVIAQRRLSLLGGESPGELVVTLGKPTQDPSDGAWTCAYELKCGEHFYARHAMGEDAMQALQLALAILDIEIHVFAKRLSGALYHYDQPFESILQDGRLKTLNFGDPR